MVMPGMGGEELFLRLREINPAVRAVLSTGFSDEGRAAEFLARGVSGFIQKPYDVHHLLVKLRAVLAQPGHGGEAAPPS
jgi:DNA-binding NarL/FixJ family response regulator